MPARLQAESKIWEQIEEDRYDYQYFKRYDSQKLKKTLKLMRKNGFGNGHCIK